MPNENLEQYIKKEDQILPIQNHGLISSETVLAGLLVQHKLLPHRYLVEGFIVNDYYMNFKDFVVDGSKIYYKRKKGKNRVGWASSYAEEEDYLSLNSLIYYKIVVDSKKNRFSKYFKNEKEFIYRDESKMFSPYISLGDDGLYKINRGHGLSDFNQFEFEYYLYMVTTADIPECSADQVFALCKYYEDDDFKYSIFHFHEIYPLSNQ